MKVTSCRLASALSLVGILLATTACQEGYSRDVPYVPTPEHVVKRMLELGEVGPGDILYDLGSGDGRIVISAVRDFNADRAVGIDIDHSLIWESQKNAIEAGVSDRARFLHENVFEADFSEATILTMYMFTRINVELRPRILSEMKPGTRVVSHQFDMEEWKPDETVKVGSRVVHMWIVPAQAAGSWHGTLDGGPVRIDLSQVFQNVSGRLTVDGNGPSVEILDASLWGDRLRFSVPVRRAGRAETMQLDARINRDSLSGTLTIAGQSHPFAAQRGD